MKQKQLIAICLIINSLVVLLCGCGGIDKEKLAKLKKELQKNSTSISQTLTETTTIETTTENVIPSSTKFIAQGNTTLMNFLMACEDNGYSILKPHRDDDIVTAFAKGENASFTIKYFCESQHVFMVKIVNNNMATSDEYMDCVMAMAKSINPDINTSKLKSNVKKSIKNPNRGFVTEQTYFDYDSAVGTFTITH